MPYADLATLAQPPHAVVVPVAATPWVTITVRPGDTLWDIAIAHHTTVASIVEKNRLGGGGSVIQIGQRLLVPGAAPTARRPAPKPAPAKPAPGKPAPGKPATGKAATAKPDADADAKPDARAGVTAAGGIVYVVRSGDTMTDIATRHRVSLTKLLAANKLPNPHLIYVGQRVVVPVARSTARPATPAPVAAPPPGYVASGKTVKAVAESKARLAATTVPTRAETSAMIRATAARQGVDPKLALAVGWLESGWYQRAVSYTDAVGVMQIMPTSADWASELAGRTLDRYGTQDNITAGVLILRALQAVASSREEAIAGYYQGLRSVRTNGMYDDTKAYVASIQAISKRL
jgi:LysM repeat protein